MIWLLANWRYLAAGVLLVAAFGFGWRFGSAGLRADLARAEARHAAQVADWHRQSSEASQAALRRQQALQLDVDTAREDLSHAKDRIREQDARIGRLSVDSGRLRDQLAAYASGTGEPNPGASCPARAAALADAAAEGSGLLIEGAELLRQAATAHDTCTAEVRALLQAWPRNHAEDH